MNLPNIQNLENVTRHGRSTTGYMSVNPSIFCLCSENEMDTKWTSWFQKYLKSVGMKDVQSCTDFVGGLPLFEQLEAYLQKIKHLVIVLSPISSKNAKYKKMFECSILFLQEENEHCRVIPILLTDDTKLPLILRDRIPFIACREDIQKLVNSLLTVNDENILKTYVYNKIHQFQTTQYLHNLNKCVLPPNMTVLEKHLGANVLEWWGLKMSECILTINMKKIYMIGKDQKILLKDLFTGMFFYESVRTIRITGLENFSSEHFERQSDLYSELVDIYIAIMNYISKDTGSKMWYHYRRHGIKHTEGTFGPLLKAMSCIYAQNIHSKEFSEEDSRFLTFHNFPLKCDNFRRKLAQAGLFYFGYLDYVQCFCCGGCMRSWTVKENPLLRHALRFSSCSYIQEKYKKFCQENEIVHSESTPQFDERKSTDGINEVEINTDKMLNIFPETLINKYHENYRDVNHRIASFEKFKEETGRFDVDDSVLKLYAEAGFFYYGVKEDVLCFAKPCNLGLSNVSEINNPWLIHFSLSPDCPHVISNKDKVTLSDHTSNTTDAYTEIELKCRKAY